MLPSPTHIDCGPALKIAIAREGQRRQREKEGRREDQSRLLWHIEQELLGPQEKVSRY